ncbi:MAG: fused MFS/spermidine synthase [Thermodesulfobacteriota bacterium]|nr:MAG: fused MFS/spermidine synthase [Thermodesulfobacteriota bacterium]
MIRLVIFLLFFGSGMTGLIYQVVWTKLLTLEFGVTLLAISTVLTTFFGGLALGSFLGGRWIDRRKNCFLWYGTAEALIGLYALVFLVLLGLNNSFYVFLARGLAPGFFGLSLIKFFLSALLLIIPTTLLGATLPILSKTIARSRKRFAKDIGGLYAVNTFGAVAGALLTAFVFIPSFGLATILYSAGILNLLIGSTAILLGWFYADGFGAPEVEEAPAPKGAGPEGAPLPGYFTTLIMWGFAISGFTGLTYEVIWTRVLGFMLTGTVYAFAVVLGVFLTGIATGSLVFSAFIDRFRSRGSVITLFAVVEVLIGISSIALIILYAKLPEMGFYARLDTTPDWGEFVYLNFFIAFITLIVPTFLFGATFPLVCKIYDWRAENVGTKIGNIYSVNTVGGIVGSFVGGFVLIPFVGMQNSIVLIGALNIVMGIFFLVLNPLSGTSVKFAYSAIGVLAAAFIIWALPANMPFTINKSFLSRDEDVVYYREGPTATVMISEKKGAGLMASNKRLWVNGNRATAAFYEGLQINRFQGVLPMVLHPDPKDVLVICFGSGTTFGTLSQFPVTMVDNIEIARSVINGAGYFKKENMDVLNNPRSRIIIDDGRSYLAVTSKKYDVITEEPMHPSLAGVVNLYTREYYELAKSRLKKGGIMSQWIPLYNLSIEDVRIMVRTFQSVFPHTSIWLVNTDIFMIGSPGELRVDFSRVRDRLSLPNIKKLLEDIDLEDPYDFLSTFVMNEVLVRKYAAGARVMSDDMPIIEFTGPVSLHLNTISPNIAQLLGYREPVINYLTDLGDYDGAYVAETLSKKFFAGRYNLIGRAYFADANFAKAARYFHEALSVDSEDRNSLHYTRKLRFY